MRFTFSDIFNVLLVYVLTNILGYINICREQTEYIEYISKKVCMSLTNAEIFKRACFVFSIIYSTYRQFFLFFYYYLSSRDAGQKTEFLGILSKVVIVQGLINRKLLKRKGTNFFKDISCINFKIKFRNSLIW